MAIIIQWHLCRNHSGGRKSKSPWLWDKTTASYSAFCLVEFVCQNHFMRYGSCIPRHWVMQYYSATVSFSTKPKPLDILWHYFDWYEFFQNRTFCGIMTKRPWGVAWVPPILRHREILPTNPCHKIIQFYTTAMGS